MALSKTCQSSAARGFKPASAESQATSKSLIRVLAAGKSPLSTMVATFAAMLLNEDRSPSLDAAFVCGTEVARALVDGDAAAVSAGLEHPAASIKKAMVERKL